MDLRDEVAGTHGTIWLNHFLRTGFEMFTRRRRRRLRRREGRDVGRLAVPGRRRGRPSSATSTCSATCSRRSTRAARRRRRSTTATSSTRSWTPATGRRRRTPGSRSSSSGAAATTPRIASTPETYEGQVVIKREILPDGRAQADPQGPGDGRLHATGSWPAAERPARRPSDSSRTRSVVRIAKRERRHAQLGGDRTLAGASSTNTVRCGFEPGPLQQVPVDPRVGLDSRTLAAR